ncbi:MAG: hypothetical protein WC846_01545 [Candidatus Gracilibacteria bacterium]|jgi:hypothetical protein
MAQVNTLYDPKTDNQPIDPQVQKMLNTPLADSSGFSADDQMLLNLIMQKVDQKEINLLAPSSLLNTAVYEGLTPENKAKADKNAVILLAKIREIYSLMRVYTEPTFQIKNLVASLRLTKERLEEHADLFVI